MFFNVELDIWMHSLLCKKIVCVHFSHNILRFYPYICIPLLAKKSIEREQTILSKENVITVLGMIDFLKSF